MKTVQLLACCLGILFAFSSQAQDQKGIGRIQKINGYEAYFFCEPLRAYQITLNAISLVQPISLITGGTMVEDASQRATYFVMDLAKKAKKQGVAMDAVVYSSGMSASGISFLQGTEQDKQGLARVKVINSFEIYFLAEPLRQYDVVRSFVFSFNSKSGYTNGIINNSLEEDMGYLSNRVLRKLKRKKQQADAIIYSGGRTAIAVKFRN